MALLRNSGTLFSYNPSATAKEWSERFQNNGCDESVIEDILQNNYVKDIENLFNAYMRVLPDFRKYYRLSLFEMFCLSGEETAFNEIEIYCENEKKEYERDQENVKSQIMLLEEYFQELQIKVEQEIQDKEKNESEGRHFSYLTAKEKKDYRNLPKIIPERKKNLDPYMPDCRILFYAAMSGNPMQLNRALALVKKYQDLAIKKGYSQIPVWQTKIYKGMNIFHAAILSGNVQQVKKVLELANNANVSLNKNITEDGFKVTPLHFSVLSNSLEIVQLILNLTKNIQSVDNEGFNALDYLIVKKNFEINIDDNKTLKQLDREKQAQKIDDDIESFLRSEKIIPANNYVNFYFAGYRIEEKAEEKYVMKNSF